MEKIETSWALRPHVWQKIKNKEFKCEVLLTNHQTFFASFAYKHIVSLEMQIVLKTEEIEGDLKEKLFLKLLRRINKKAREYQLRKIELSILKVESVASDFFVKQGFLEEKQINSSSDEILLIKSIGACKRKASSSLDGSDRKKQKENPLRLVSSTLRKVYIEAIREGKKNIEGRVYKGMFKNLSVGQSIRFFYFSNPKDDVTCQIEKITRYPSFQDMLNEEDFKKCVPEAFSQQEAVSLYESIPGYVEKARLHGVVAIQMSRL